MKLDAFNKLLLETVGVGLIIATWPDLKVMFHNARVGEWFPGFDDADAGNLCQRIAGIDETALRAAIEAGNSHSAPFDAKVGRRTHALAITATRALLGDEPWLVVELHNNTKVRQLETMIASYS